MSHGLWLSQTITKIQDSVPSHELKDYVLLRPYLKLAFSIDLHKERQTYSFPCQMSLFVLSLSPSACTVHASAMEWLLFLVNSGIEWVLWGNTPTLQERW